ncbi:hypothetical protein CYMTET_26487, partial [Cymbomonas tetramitiformis]
AEAADLERRVTENHAVFMQQKLFWETSSSPAAHSPHTSGDVTPVSLGRKKPRGPGLQKSASIMSEVEYASDFDTPGSGKEDSGSIPDDIAAEDSQMGASFLRDSVATVSGIDGGGSVEEEDFAAARKSKSSIADDIDEEDLPQGKGTRSSMSIADDIEEEGGASGSRLSHSASVVDQVDESAEEAEDEVVTDGVPSGEISEAPEAYTEDFDSEPHYTEDFSGDVDTPVSVKHKSAGASKEDEAADLELKAKETALRQEREEAERVLEQRKGALKAAERQRRLDGLKQEEAQVKKLKEEAAQLEKLIKAQGGAVPAAPKAAKKTPKKMARSSGDSSEIESIVEEDEEEENYDTEFDSDIPESDMGGSGGVSGVASEIADSGDLGEASGSGSGDVVSEVSDAGTPKAASKSGRAKVGGVPLHLSEMEEEEAAKLKALEQQVETMRKEARRMQVAAREQQLKREMEALQGVITQSQKEMDAPPARAPAEIPPKRAAALSGEISEAETVNYSDSFDGSEESKAGSVEESGLLHGASASGEIGSIVEEDEAGAEAEEAADDVPSIISESPVPGKASRSVSGVMSVSFEAPEEIGTPSGSVRYSDDSFASEVLSAAGPKSGGVTQDALNSVVEETPPHSPVRLATSVALSIADSEAKSEAEKLEASIVDSIAEEASKLDDSIVDSIVEEDEDEDEEGGERVVDARGAISAADSVVESEAGARSDAAGVSLVDSVAESGRDAYSASFEQYSKSFEDPPAHSPAHSHSIGELRDSHTIMPSPARSVMSVGTDGASVIDEEGSIELASELELSGDEEGESVGAPAYDYEEPAEPMQPEAQEPPFEELHEEAQIASVRREAQERAGVLGVVEIAPGSPEALEDGELSTVREDSAELQESLGLEPDEGDEQGVWSAEFEQEVQEREEDSAELEHSLEAASEEKDNVDDVPEDMSEIEDEISEEGSIDFGDAEFSDGGEEQDPPPPPPPMLAPEKGASAGAPSGEGLEAEVASPSASGRLSVGDVSQVDSIAEESFQLSIADESYAMSGEMSPAARPPSSPGGRSSGPPSPAPHADAAAEGELLSASIAEDAYTASFEAPSSAPGQSGMGDLGEAQSDSTAAAAATPAPASISEPKEAQEGAGDTSGALSVGAHSVDEVISEDEIMSDDDVSVEFEEDQAPGSAPASPAAVPATPEDEKAEVYSESFNNTPEVPPPVQPEAKSPESPEEEGVKPPMLAVEGSELGGESIMDSIADEISAASESLLGESGLMSPGGPKSPALAPFSASNTPTRGAEPASASPSAHALAAEEEKEEQEEKEEVYSESFSESAGLTPQAEQAAAGSPQAPSSAQEPPAAAAAADGEEEPPASPAAATEPGDDSIMESIADEMSVASENVLGDSGALSPAAAAPSADTAGASATPKAEDPAQEEPEEQEEVYSASFNDSGISPERRAPSTETEEPAAEDRTECVTQAQPEAEVGDELEAGDEDEDIDDLDISEDIGDLSVASIVVPESDEEEERQQQEQAAEKPSVDVDEGADSGELDLSIPGTPESERAALNSGFDSADMIEAPPASPGAFEEEEEAEVAAAADDEAKVAEDAEKARKEKEERVEAEQKARLAAEETARIAEEERVRLEEEEERVRGGGGGKNSGGGGGGGKNSGGGGGSKNSGGGGGGGGGKNSGGGEGKNSEEEKAAARIAEEEEKARVAEEEAADRLSEEQKRKAEAAEIEEQQAEDKPVTDGKDERTEGRYSAATIAKLTDSILLDLLTKEAASLVGKPPATPPKSPEAPSSHLPLSPPPPPPVIVDLPEEAEAQELVESPSAVAEEKSPTVLMPARGLPAALEDSVRGDPDAADSEADSESSQASSTGVQQMMQKHAVNRTMAADLANSTCEALLDEALHEAMDIMTRAGVELQRSAPEPQASLEALHETESGMLDGLPSHVSASDNADYDDDFDEYEESPEASYEDPMTPERAQDEAGAEEESPPPGSPEGERVQMDQEYVMQYVDEVLEQSPFLEGQHWDPSLGDPLPVELFLKIERSRDQVSDLQHIYNKLLFDAIGESLTKVVVHGGFSAPAWLQRSPQLGQGQLTGPLKGEPLRTAVKKHIQSWAQAQCGEDLGEIDTMLATEIRDEKNWMAFEEEESFLKFELSDNIFSNLLEDTISALRPGVGH